MTAVVVAFPHYTWPKMRSGNAGPPRRLVRLGPIQKSELLLLLFFVHSDVINYSYWEYQFVGGLFVLLYYVYVLYTYIDI